MNAPRGQITKFTPKLNNQNGAMTEPQTVRMIADVTFTNRQHEGQVRRRHAFYTTERRAKELEKHGHAHRAPVVAPVARGPSVTKPAAPAMTKPATAAEIKGAPPRPIPKPKPRPKLEEPIPPPVEMRHGGPLAKGYFTVSTLKAELRRMDLFFKSGESKKVLYQRYVEHFAQEA